MSKYEELHYEISVDKIAMSSRTKAYEQLLHNLDVSQASIGNLHQVIEQLKASDVPNSRRVLELIKSDLKQLQKESEKI